MTEKKTVARTICVTFPLPILEKWDEDCKKNYGDCRWMKCWNDHLAAKREPILNALLGELSMLKARIEKLEGKTETKEPLTLGKGGLKK